MASSEDTAFQMALIIQGVAGLLCNFGKEIRQEQLKSTEDGSILKLHSYIVCKVGLHLGQCCITVLVHSMEIQAIII